MIVFKTTLFDYVDKSIKTCSRCVLPNKNVISEQFFSTDNDYRSDHPLLDLMSSHKRLPTSLNVYNGKHGHPGEQFIIAIHWYFINKNYRANKGQQVKNYFFLLIFDFFRIGK